jgi:hypothetical protein
MSFLVTRGMGENGTFVTAGLGTEDGTIFLKALAGVITMVGSLSTLFIPGTGGPQNDQGGIRIDIDIGI